MSALSSTSTPPTFLSIQRLFHHLLDSIENHDIPTKSLERYPSNPEVTIDSCFEYCEISLGWDKIPASKSPSINININKYGKFIDSMREVQPFSKIGGGGCLFLVI
jgi:hypothetical protein